jgi:tRNA threonylcarbamoyladenosine biosynthesis protein TsaE
MDTPITITAHAEGDTGRLGAALAALLPAGTVVALVGTLGAGKTRLVQAVATELGVAPGQVTSPTFVLVNEYRGGRMPVYHFDTYRLKDEDEFLALGPEEYFDADGITFVEWADRVADLLPEQRLEITLEVIGETERRITIHGTTPRMVEIVTKLREKNI